MTGRTSVRMDAPDAQEDTKEGSQGDSVSTPASTPASTPVRRENTDKTGETGQKSQRESKKAENKKASRNLPATTRELDWPDWTRPVRGATRTLPLSPFESRAPYRPWWERHDLWWSDELFGNGNPTWRTPGKSLWTTTTTLTGEVARRRVFVPEFSGKASTRSPHVRNVISTLIMWHHATSRQLATICGHHPANFSARILKPLFDAGVIERGRFATSSASTNLRHDYCYQLRIGDPLWRWLDHFDDETWTKITYGEVPTEPPSYVRHNLLAFEVGLRAMESLPNLTAVYGEQVTSMRKVLGADNRQRGDIGIVRGDGLRIIVELVHEQYREGFSKKVASWGRELTKRGTVNDHGTVVVFLLAPRLFSDSIGEARRRFREALSPAGLTDPVSGVAADPNTVANARLHVFMATWPDWFPGPHTLSDEFLRLTSWRLTATDGWQSVDVMNPDDKKGYPFKPKDPLAWFMPAEAFAGLYGQPSWLRGAKDCVKDDTDHLVIPSGFPSRRSRAQEQGRL